MEFLVVAHSDLTRAASRILAVLERAHRAALLTPEQLAVSEPPGPGVGTLLVGEFPEADALRAQAPPSWSSHGAQFGVHGNQAWIFGAAVDDPQAALQAIGWEVAELTDQAEAALLKVDKSDPSQLTGLHLAGLYLDPYLQVPAETVRAGKIDFSPARMCWERQYTYGIARFLASGFDDFAASLK